MVATAEHRTTRRPRRALSIEGLLDWAFRVERVHLVSFYGGGGADAYVKVDSSGGGGGISSVHGDAITIYDAVNDLPRTARALVINNAQAGTRPDWYKDPRRRIVPRSWTDSRKDARWPKRRSWPGRAALAREVDWDRPPMHKGRPYAQYYCEVIHYGEPDAVATTRRMYSTWSMALHALKSALSGNLDDHIVGRALPPVTPWLATTKTVDMAR